MKAGEYNQLIIVERETPTSDGAGGASHVWVEYCREWGKAVPTGGNERMVAGTLRARQGWRVTIHWRGDITVEHRLRIGVGGPVVDIQSAEDLDGKHEDLVILGETTGVPA